MSKRQVLCPHCNACGHKGCPHAVAHEETAACLVSCKYTPDVMVARSCACTEVEPVLDELSSQLFTYPAARRFSRNVLKLVDGVEAKMRDMEEKELAGWRDQDYGPSMLYLQARKAIESIDRQNIIRDFRELARNIIAGRLPTDN